MKYKIYKETINIRLAIEQDGYNMKSVDKLDSSRVYYYEHKNGNRISLFVDLAVGKIVMSKNGKVTKVVNE